VARPPAGRAAARAAHHDRRGPRAAPYPQRSPSACGVLHTHEGVGKVERSSHPQGRGETGRAAIYSPASGRISSVRAGAWPRFPGSRSRGPPLKIDQPRRPRSAQGSSSSRPSGLAESGRGSRQVQEETERTGATKLIPENILWARARLDGRLVADRGLRHAAARARAAHRGKGLGANTRTRRQHGASASGWASVLTTMVITLSSPQPWRAPAAARRASAERAALPHHAHQHGTRSRGDRTRKGGSPWC